MPAERSRPRAGPRLTGVRVSLMYNGPGSDSPGTGGPVSGGPGSDVIPHATCATQLAQIIIGRAGIKVHLLA